MSARHHEDCEGHMPVHQCGNGDVYDAGGNRQLFAAADGCVQSIVRVGVPDWNNFGHLHGYGLIGQCGNLFVPDERLQLLFAG